jgi:ATP-binding cassette subfamily C exporter for protease/lipase
MSTVGELKAKGKTVFLVTHRPGAINAADWLLLLKDGELVASGPRDEVIATLQKAQRPARGPEPSSALTPRPA